MGDSASASFMLKLLNFFLKYMLFTAPTKTVGDIVQFTSCFTLSNSDMGIPSVIEVKRIERRDINGSVQWCYISSDPNVVYPEDLIDS